MNTTDRSCVIRLAEARARIPGSAGEHSASFLQRGTLNVKLALAPPARPTQLTAHAQDEVYVVIRGQGVLLHAGARNSFESGDILFVAAGIEHRFEDFTDDLVVWVVFYGPQGGEISA